MNKSKLNNIFEQHLNEDDLQKLAPIINMGLLEELFDLIKAAICDKYNQIYAASEKMTVREYFAQHIEEIAQDNQKYASAFDFAKKTIDKIKSGEMKHNIKGFVKNCSNPDVLIIDVQVQKNVPALKYNERDNTWDETTTTLIRFATTQGKYMYVSALNSLKTESYAIKYLDQIDRYYYYKNRNKNVA